MLFVDTILIFEEIKTFNNLFTCSLHLMFLSIIVINIVTILNIII